MDFHNEDNESDVNKKSKENKNDQNQSKKENVVNKTSENAEKSEKNKHKIESEESIRESLKNESYLQESESSCTNGLSSASDVGRSKTSVPNEISDRKETENEIDGNAKKENRRITLEFESKRVEKIFEAGKIISEDDINANHLHDSFKVESVNVLQNQLDEHLRDTMDRTDNRRMSNISRLTKSFDCGPACSIFNSESSSHDSKEGIESPIPVDPKKVEYQLVEFEGLRENPNLTCAIAVDVLPAITPVIPIPEIKKEEIKPEIPEPSEEISPTISVIPKTPEIIVEKEEEKEEKLPLWMVTPKQMPPNCPAGLEFLAELNYINIYQTAYFDGWTTSTNYMVRNKHGQNVYKVNAHMPSCFFNFVCTTCRRFELSFLDGRGIEVMHFTRPRAKKGERSLEIYAPFGNLIGKVREDENVSGLFTVYDTTNEVISRIEMKRRLSNNFSDTFNVLSVTGHNVVGKIHLESISCMKIIQHKNYYSVQFFTNLDAKIKATILGASFLINFIYFELF